MFFIYVFISVIYLFTISTLLYCISLYFFSLKETLGEDWAVTLRSCYLQSFLFTCSRSLRHVQPEKWGYNLSINIALPIYYKSYERR